MTVLIRLVNEAATSLFGLLLWPFQRFEPIWGMVFISLLTGLLILWTFGRFSNQRAIVRVRNRIWGNLLAVRLYRHEVAVVLRLQIQILRDTLTYMSHLFVPLLVLSVPISLVVIQLNLYFALKPLQPGQAAVVKATVKERFLLPKDISLNAPSGIEVETPALRIPSQREIAC